MLCSESKHSFCWRKELGPTSLYSCKFIHCTFYTLLNRRILTHSLLLLAMMLHSMLLLLLLLLYYWQRCLIQGLQLCNYPPKARPVLGCSRPAAASQSNIPGRGTFWKLRSHSISDDGLKHLSATSYQVIEGNLYRTEGKSACVVAT